MSKKMVTLTFPEPKNCMMCPAAHMGAGSVYCAGHGTGLFLVEEIKSPNKPRPKSCPLKDVVSDEKEKRLPEARP